MILAKNRSGPSPVELILRLDNLHYSPQIVQYSDDVVIVSIEFSLLFQRFRETPNDRDTVHMQIESPAKLEFPVHRLSNKTNRLHKFLHPRFESYFDSL